MLKLLVVDDDFLSTEFVRLYLEDKGFDVCIADSVKSALDIINEQRPVGVYTDLQLSDGSGVEIARRARESGASLVVGISGYDRHTLEKKGICLDSFYELLDKPLDLARLDQTLDQLTLKTFCNNPNQSPIPKAGTRC